MIYPEDFINKIICGDCLDVMRDIPNDSIDLIIIDPPYLTTKESWDQEEVVNEKLSSELFRVAKNSCSLYVWCGIGEKSQSLIRWFPIFNDLWHFKDLITWKKSRGMGMRKGWLYTREECMWFVKNNKKFIWNKEHQYSTQRRKRDGGKDKIRVSQNGYYIKSVYKRWKNVWCDISEQSHAIINSEHGTQKPEELIKRIVLPHTKTGDIVLDCFIGSGTTAVVAKKYGRKFIGIDNSEKYCDIAKKRLSE